jgi:biopolymer transport protein ExbD
MSHRNRKVDPGLGVNLGLIITPMLDMAFQLMAFFIMTYHPPLKEGQIRGVLAPPVSQEEKKVKKKDVILKGKTKPDDKAPPPEEKDKTKKDEEEKDKELDTKEDVDVVAYVFVEVAGSANAGDATKNKGDPGGIKIKFREDATPRQLSGPGESFAKGLEKLGKELNGLSPERKKGKLQVETHPDLRTQYFIQVMDVCRGARFGGYNFTKTVRPKK